MLNLVNFERLIFKDRTQGYRIIGLTGEILFCRNEFEQLDAESGQEDGNMKIRKEGDMGTGVME